jgi:pimeloyl-ACP methyl ester carboxylesterase
MRPLLALLLIVLAAATASAEYSIAPPTDAEIQELQSHGQDPPPAPTPPALTGDPAKAVVLIFNHGTYRPQRRHVCNESRDVPAVVRDLAQQHGWLVHYLCSTATDEGVDGSYTYKRADEILAVVADYRKRGVPAERIFLLGHSAGGWSSLMAARKDHSGFNALIAFAPAFAGPRHEAPRYPWWRGKIQPAQIAYLREAKRIEALIIAYSDDDFDRPEEIAPLDGIPGVRVLAFDACNAGHGTTYSQCFREGAKAEIEDYLKTRLKAH